MLRFRREFFISLVINVMYVLCDTLIQIVRFEVYFNTLFRSILTSHNKFFGVLRSYSFIFRRYRNSSFFLDFSQTSLFKGFFKIHSSTWHHPSLRKSREPGGPSCKQKMPCLIQNIAANSHPHRFFTDLWIDAKVIMKFAIFS